MPGQRHLLGKALGNLSTGPVPEVYQLRRAVVARCSGDTCSCTKTYIPILIVGTTNPFGLAWCRQQLLRMSPPVLRLARDLLCGRFTSKTECTLHFLRQIVLA